MEFGNRIRARRQELGLSLRELAEQVGLTASFLSQIERDLTSPSIESLRKISDALEVPIFHFLLEVDKKSPVVRRGERLTLTLPNSDLSYKLLTPDLSRSGIRAWWKGGTIPMGRPGWAPGLPRCANSWVARWRRRRR